MNILSKFSLENKIAIITGGYSHLGKSICEAIFEAGGTAIICGKSIDKYHKVFNRKQNHNYHFIELDVSSTASIKSAFKKINRRHKKIDILVNNAFYLKSNYPEIMSDKEWDQGIDGTLNSIFRCIREIIPYMKMNKISNIINISSMYGLVSPDFNLYNKYPDFFNPPNYGSAKAGVIQLTKYYAVYLSKYNIRVNCISPGAFPSQEIQKKKSFIKALNKKIPLDRIGEPKDLKGVVVFLASDASSYITGQNIIVDGGWTVW